MPPSPFRGECNGPRAVEAATETPSEVCPNAASLDVTPPCLSSQLDDSSQTACWTEDVPLPPS
eukprot:749080-Pyramimonas_sp.AAC.1